MAGYTMSVAAALSAIVGTTSAQLFTSTARLSQLLTPQPVFLSAFDSYVAKEQDRIHALESVREQLLELESIAPEDSGFSAPEHPIGAFHLMKGFDGLSQAIRNAEDNLNDFKAALKKADPFLPSNEHDREGALSAILRLQILYSLPIEELMEGYIVGHRVRGLSARDAQNIGNHACTLDRFESVAVEWWMAANQAQSVVPVLTPTEHVALLTNLTEVYLKQGDTVNATKFINQAVTLYGKDPDIAPEISELEKALKIPDAHGPDMAQQVANRTKIPHIFRRSYSANYSRLCRGDVQSTSSDPTTSFCLLSYGLGAYSPVKVEVLATQPFIAILHDVLSDREIADLKVRSLEQLRNSMNALESRVAQISWFFDNSPSVQKISKRVMGITGLDVAARDVYSSEPLQVANYGIGGHYDPHYDFTQLLGEVLEGGATVFPRIGVRVPATKNAALLWYNLRRSGDVERQTLHAACPVLLGQKWIATKWIRESGQEFRHRCGLTRDAQHYSFSS